LPVNNKWMLRQKLNANPNALPNGKFSIYNVDTAKNEDNIYIII